MCGKQQEIRPSYIWVIRLNFHRVSFVQLLNLTNLWRQRPISNSHRRKAAFQSSNPTKLSRTGLISYQKCSISRWLLRYRDKPAKASTQNFFAPRCQLCRIGRKETQGMRRKRQGGWFKGWLGRGRGGQWQNQTFLRWMIKFCRGITLFMCIVRGWEVGKTKGDDQRTAWGGSHQNSTKTKNTKPGAWKIGSVATRELKCLSSGAISAGCFVLFGLRWSVQLSALRSASIGSPSPVSRSSSRAITHRFSPPVFLASLFSSCFG